MRHNFWNDISAMHEAIGFAHATLLTAITEMQSTQSASAAIPANNPLLELYKREARKMAAARKAYEDTE